MEYKINPRTLAIIPINRRRSKIYENDNVFIIQQNSQKIIAENCEYFGSSYLGRKKGTTELIGVTHKAPILIEDTNNIIFFPTCSPRHNDCMWLSLNNIDSFQAYDGDALIKFTNNYVLQVNASAKVINNQVLRSTRLESVIQKRRAKLDNKKTQEKYENHLN